MLANNKRLKKQVIDLRLPWWLKLVKSGIPYTVAAATSIMVTLTLGGWLAMPESIQLLKWVEALFMAMSPAVKFLAVTSIGLGSFLSTFEIFSVFVRGFLYHYAEKAASEGLEVAEQLAEQNKELRENLVLQMKLNEQIKNQTELLKGYAKGLHFSLDKKALSAPESMLNLDTLNQTDEPTLREPQQVDLSEVGAESGLDEEEPETTNPEEKPEEENAAEDPIPPKQPEPVLFSAHTQRQQPRKDKRHKDKFSRHQMLSSRPQRRLVSNRTGNYATGSSEFNKRHRNKQATNGF